MTRVKHTLESDLLTRLKKAIQVSGLVADLTVLSSEEKAIVVTNRLAQTTIRYLTNRVDSDAGQRLSETLRTLTGAVEYELLMEDRGHTFFHVVQFLYEFARAYTKLSAPEDFCSGTGRGGGGLAVEPHKEVISLVQLLITALPPNNDQRNIGVLMQTLGPLMLGQIFTTGLFNIAVEPEGENGLKITLQYADQKLVTERLQALDLAGDIGTFFLNSALHIQGTLQLGWATFAAEAEQTLDMGVLIEDRDAAQKDAIIRDCMCSWMVTWTPDVRLNRMVDDAEIFQRAHAVFDALQRKDLEYYLERIKHLEMQVQAMEEEGHFHALVGKSDAMRRVYQMIEQVAVSDLTVLIRGETGTGKELVARAIHEYSPRKDRPFVAVNCAAFSEGVLESELFGHEKGAFTGADRTKLGRFELANQGTLFLDEVGDIPLTTQVKLLRMMETQAFERVGGTQTVQTDVRILGATNRNLEEMITQGEFREDFFFRLNVLPMFLPRLRERREDIPLLAQHFLMRSAQRAGKDVRGFSRGAINRLMNQAWPGNIRMLLNVIERAVVVYTQGTTVTEGDIVQALGMQAVIQPRLDLNLRQRRILEVMDDGAGCHVDDLISALSAEIEDVGLSRRTLQNDLKKLTDLGYVAWQKQSNARLYGVTQNGKAVIQNLIEE